MRAIVLVGGLGTRLRAFVPDLPKPMAPIRDQPFLAYLLKYLQKQGMTQVILPVHYMAEKIQAYFKSDFAGLSIQYVVEEELLGTGGAIVNALKEATVTEPIFILNGDTFAQLDYAAMFAQHQANQATLTMALCNVPDATRYGKVETASNNIIVEFKEKGETGSGWINAGVYLLDPVIFAGCVLPRQFSFESEFLLPNLSQLQAQAYFAQDYFIDIGIPEDYIRANNELPRRVD